MSSKTSSQSMTSSSLTTGFTQENQLKDVTQEWESKLGIQNTEIKQDNLKTQIVSAITDLEGDRDLADFGKENKTIDLMSPPQAKSPTPKNPHSLRQSRIHFLHQRTMSFHLHHWNDLNLLNNNNNSLNSCQSFLCPTVHLINNQ